LVFVFQLKTGVFFGNILANNFFMFKFVVKISLAVSLSIFTTSATILILNDDLFWQKSSPFPNSQFSKLPDGQVFRHFQKISLTRAPGTVFSPYPSRNKLNVSMSFFFTFARNLMLNRCSVFIKHDSGTLKSFIKIITGHYVNVTERGLAHS
jgi:hypothetical protein